MFVNDLHFDVVQGPFRLLRVLGLHVRLRLARRGEILALAGAQRTDVDLATHVRPSVVAGQVGSVGDVEDLAATAALDQDCVDGRAILGRGTHLATNLGLTEKRKLPSTEYGVWTVDLGTGRLGVWADGSWWNWNWKLRKSIRVEVKGEKRKSALH